MFSSLINSILSLILVLSLNETASQRLDPRDAGYISQYQRESSTSDDHQGSSEVEEIRGRLALDLARRARETLIDSYAARDHEVYSKGVKNGNVDESSRFMERAGRGMQRRHISLLPDEDEVVDLESLPGEKIKLTRFACNYSKRSNRADYLGGSLPAMDKVVIIGAERPLQEGSRLGKALEILDGKKTSEALSRSGIRIDRGEAATYRLVTVYRKSRITTEHLINFSIIIALVFFIFYNIYRQRQELFKHGQEKLCTSQQQPRPQEPSTQQPAPPAEETALQTFTTPCDSCRTLTAVIDELLSCLTSSQVILSSLEKQIQNRLRLRSARKSTQMHGKSSQFQKTREKSKPPEDKEEESEYHEEEEESEYHEEEEESEYHEEEESEHHEEEEESEFHEEEEESEYHEQEKQKPEYHEEKSLEEDDFDLTGKTVLSSLSDENQ